MKVAFASCVDPIDDKEQEVWGVVEQIRLMFYFCSVIMCIWITVYDLFQITPCIALENGQIKGFQMSCIGDI